MPYIKKIIVLNAVQQEKPANANKAVSATQTSGVLKIDCNKLADITIDLKRPPKNGILLLSTKSKTLKIKLDSFKFSIPSDDFSETYCLVLDGDTPMMYGSTKGNIKRCLSLQNIAKTLDFVNFDNINEFNYIDKSVKNSDKKADDNSALYTNTVPNAFAPNADAQTSAAQVSSALKSTDHASEARSSETLKSNTQTSATSKAGKQISADNISNAQSSASHDAETKKSADNLSNTQSSARKSPSFVMDEGVHYEGDNFYYAVRPQLDEMFVCYPAEAVLNNLVPFSRWIKVDVEDDYYVVGIVADENAVVQFICYGIHGNFVLKPPEEIRGICEWLPLDVENKTGEGYWIIYQDAKTGKCLKGN